MALSSISDELLDEIIEFIGAPVLIIDVHDDGRFSYAHGNEAAITYFDDNRTRDELRGVYLDDFTGLNERQILQNRRAIDNYRKCLEAGAAIYTETEHHSAKGKVRWGRHCLVPIYDDKGTARKIFISSGDVTELVETQKNLENAMSKMLSGFVKICASCKKIHHEDEWIEIEVYAAKKMDYTSFSHGVCTDCVSQYD